MLISCSQSCSTLLMHPSSRVISQISFITLNNRCVYDNLYAQAKISKYSLIAMSRRRKDQIEVVGVLVDVKEHGAIVAFRRRYRLDHVRRKTPLVNSCNIARVKQYNVKIFSTSNINSF